MLCYGFVRTPPSVSKRRQTRHSEIADEAGKEGALLRNHLFGAVANLDFSVGSTPRLHAEGESVCIIGAMFFYSSALSFRQTYVCHLSLRFGHFSGLTVHRTVIQYLEAASLPPGWRFRMSEECRVQNDKPSPWGRWMPKADG